MINHKSKISPDTRGVTVHSVGSNHFSHECLLILNDLFDVSVDELCLHQRRVPTIERIQLKIYLDVFGLIVQERDSIEEIPGLSS